jgi:hypothetical protein
MEIAQLQQVNKKFMRAVDLWLDSIVAGFIIEFVVDTAMSYRAAEQDFLKGPRGRYIISLYTSINILLYEKGVIVDMDGVRTMEYFEVIEIVDGTTPYPTLLGLDWEFDNQVVINLKTMKMNFESG